MGQKVPIERPRVRTTDDKEVRLGSYEMFHRGEPLTETVWDKLMLGLSTRQHGQAVREFSQAYGLEKKSAISEDNRGVGSATLGQSGCEGWRWSLDYAARPGSALSWMGALATLFLWQKPLASPTTN
jgi:hypothetical protein